jgi:hypothetical protein
MSRNTHAFLRIALYATLAIAVLVSIILILSLLPVLTGQIPYPMDGKDAIPQPAMSDPGILPPELLVLLLLADCTVFLAVYLYMWTREKEICGSLSRIPHPDPAPRMERGSSIRYKIHGIIRGNYT